MRAFSLIELLVVLAVAAILLSVAVPSLQGMADERRLRGLQIDLAWDLRRARSEAMTRQVTTVLCASEDGASCALSWTGGWIVFVDQPGGTALSLDAADTLVTYRQSESAGSEIEASMLTRGRWSGTSAATNQVIFDGYRRGASGFFILCDERGLSAARSIRLSASGEVGLEAARDVDEVLLDTWGEEGECPT